MAQCHGLVVKGLGGLYEIETDLPGHLRLSCRAKGAFRHEDVKVLVGDRVEVRYEEEDPESTAVIREILPRHSFFIRPPLANLDTLLAVIAAARPTPVLETVDRLIAIAVHNKVTPVLVVTKSDFGEEESHRYADIYRKVGIPVFVVSGEEGDGVPALRAYLDETVRDGRIAAFAGASGVGKSTLMNALFPHLSLATGEVSQKIARGRHTTRHVELFPTEGGGYIADTPGFSLLDFARFDFMELGDLFDAFPEFRPYFGKCRYADCTHTGEGPDICAIARAVADGIIPPSRHAGYCQLYRTLKLKEKNKY